MSESNNGSTDETPVTGTEGGAEEMMRAVMADQVEDARDRVRKHFDRMNNRNAGRPEVDQAAIVQGVEQRQDAVRQMVANTRSGNYAVSGVAAADDPSDPTKPVLGTTDLIEEIVANTQRYGSFAHWPNDKKGETLGLVERVVKQRAIAQQVVAVARRDSVQARAYRERKKLAREARGLIHDYLLDPNGKRTTISSGEISTESSHYAEAIDLFGRFLRKVADLPSVPEDEEASDGE